MKRFLVVLICLVLFPVLCNGAIMFDNAKGLGISIPIGVEQDIFEIDVPNLAMSLAVDFGVKNWGLSLNLMYAFQEGNVQLAPYVSISYLIIGNAGLTFTPTVGLFLGFGK